MKINALKIAGLSFALFLTGGCVGLHAQSVNITAYTEYHTRKDGFASADKKKPWQTVDLDASDVAASPVLGWRQWGGRILDTSLVHYDGSQGATAGTGLASVSDLLDYDPLNTYVGSDSYFFITYKDARTGDQVKGCRNFVFAFDGLTFTVPADANPRCLRLWTAAYACDGEMDVDLLSSTGDVLTSYSKTMTRPGATTDATAPDFFYGYWRFQYQGTGLDQTLRVHWRSLNRVQDSANICLQAAVLTSAEVTPAVH